jgi:EpsD family peptidyl-prolyl cis-trans isomerase
VNGEEVTRRDLSSEPQSAMADKGEDQPQALSVLLNGVVDRKLAAAEARRLELDRTPQYVALAKRLEEVMLSRTLFDRWAGEMSQPDQRAIAAYVTRNPQRFNGRKLFLVDGIETAMSPAQSQVLAPMQTTDAIAAYLDSHAQPYRRARTVLDSASMPLPLYRQLVGLKPGYPLALGQGTGLVTLSVIEARDMPLPAAERSAEAVKALKQQAVQRKLANLRKSADIAFQPGYRPQSLASPAN